MFHIFTHYKNHTFTLKRVCDGEDMLWCGEGGQVAVKSNYKPFSADGMRNLQLQAGQLICCSLLKLKEKAPSVV